MNVVATKVTSLIQTILHVLVSMHPIQINKVVTIGCGKVVMLFFLLYMHDIYVTISYVV